MASRRDYGDAPSLKSSAFTVFFEKVICKTIPDTVDIVRDIIDQQRTLRERCAQHLYSSMMLDQNLSYQLDIFAIMDCILEKHFKTSLQVCVPSPFMRSFTDLMAIIIHRCPNLEHLEVSFQDSVLPVSSLVLVTKRASFPIKNELYTIPPKSLLGLKSLTLNFKNTECNSGCPDYSSLLSIVGKLCPVLTKLEVTGADLSYQRDFVALIVKAEMAEILFPKHGRDRWSEYSVFSGLRIPLQFLNPLCSTLKEMILDTQKPDTFHCKYIKETAYAFALRHLPMLEKMDLGDEVGRVFPFTQVEAIKLLYHASGRNSDQKPFEEAWRKAASRLGLEVASPVTFFPDTLSLKKIYVYEYEFLLGAVTKWCPSIVEVGIIGNPNKKPPIETSEHITKMWSRIMKRFWSKIESVEFISVDRESVIMVLDVYGRNLKKLTLSGISWDIDMAHLASICTNLEHLTLLDARINLDFETACGWTPETFFPKLTHFQTNNSKSKCSGVWGVLIEKKSKLVHLSLQCCHIGTIAHRYKADSPRLEWSQLPQLWSQLESLEIGHCTGLTMTILADIIPQLSKLRCIALPSSLVDEDRALARKMEEEGVEIKNYSFPFEKSDCPFRYWI